MKSDKPEEQDGVTRDNIIDRTLSAMPQIREKYEVERNYYRDDPPGPYEFFGEFVNPYLDDILDVGAEGPLNDAFDFLESMATCCDNFVAELLAVEVIEHIANDAVRLAKARQWMRPSTLALSYQIEPPGSPD